MFHLCVAGMFASSMVVEKMGIGLEYAKKGVV